MRYISLHHQFLSKKDASKQEFEIMDSYKYNSPEYLFIVYNMLIDNLFCEQSLSALGLIDPKQTVTRNMEIIHSDNILGCFRINRSDMRMNSI